MPARPSLIEFPADDVDRARRFWTELLGVEIRDRSPQEGRGWQTDDGRPAVGVHARGRGPGDTHALAYFEVEHLQRAVERVRSLGGSVIHEGECFCVCRDSEGTPFGLAGPAAAHAETGPAAAHAQSSPAAAHAQSSPAAAHAETGPAAPHAESSP